MIRRNFLKVNESTVLRFKDVKDAETDVNGVDYYPVLMTVDPPLPKTGCKHAAVKMRYTDFEKLWEEFQSDVGQEGEEFPGKRGLQGKLRDAAPWINTSAEVEQHKQDRRTFFADLLRRIFDSLGGNTVYVSNRLCNMKCHALIDAFYTTGDKGHITAMYTGHVRNMYDCSKEE